MDESPDMFEESPSLDVSGATSEYEPSQSQPQSLPSSQSEVNIRMWGGWGGGAFFCSISTACVR